MARRLGEKPVEKCHEGIQMPRLRGQGLHKTDAEGSALSPGWTG